MMQQMYGISAMRIIQTSRYWKVVNELRGPFVGSRKEYVVCMYTLCIGGYGCEIDGV